MSNSEQLPALFSAIEKGNLNIVQDILDRNPGLIHARGKASFWTEGEGTPLQAAVESCNEQVVSDLLERGADVNDKGTLTGWAPLHLAKDNSKLSQLLVDRGADVDIHAAASLGDLERIRYIVEQDPQAVHAGGPDGATALHFASTADVADYLVEHGADIEARDKDHHMTPLGWQSGNKPVADLLVSRGAQIDNVFLAAAVGSIEHLRPFIESDPDTIGTKTPDDSDYYGPGATLLHIAAGNGHSKAVTYLLDHGADVNAKGGWFGVTPQHWAVKAGSLNVVEILLQHGADKNIADDDHGRTPLDWAHFFEQDAIAELLSQQI